jgi:hypothetical protein
VPPSAIRFSAVQLIAAAKSAASTKKPWISDPMSAVPGRPARARPETKERQWMRNNNGLDRGGGGETLARGAASCARTGCRRPQALGMAASGGLQGISSLDRSSLSAPLVGWTFDVCVMSN